MKLEIEGNRVLEAIKKYPAAQRALEILFPTVFEPAPKPKFQPGDIVRYGGSHDCALSEDGLVGKVGKVVDDRYGPMGGVGVEFQDAIDRGHDCHGTGRKYHCEYIAEGSLTLVYRQPEGEKT